MGETRLLALRRDVLRNVVSVSFACTTLHVGALLIDYGFNDRELMMTERASTPSQDTLLF